MDWVTIATKYRPVYYLHPEEQAFPITMTEFLYCTEAVGPDGALLKAGPLTPTMLHELDNVPAGSTLRYRKNLDYRKYGQRDFSTVPILVNDYDEDGKHYINYITTWGFNQPFNIALFFHVGAHQFDAEHCTLECNASGEPLRFYYAAHATENGTWKNWEDVDKEEDGLRPTVFPAVGSHASYPDEGVWFRLMGAASDVTEKGYRWDPDISMIYPTDNPLYDSESMGWMKFTGKMGNGHVSNIPQQKWFLKSNLGNQDSDPAVRMTNGREFLLLHNVSLLLLYATFLFFIVLLLNVSWRSRT